MDLRLPPGVPIVWRSPTELQLGGTTVRAVIKSPSVSAERFIESLRSPGTLEQFHERGARLGLSSAEVRALLDSVSTLLDAPPSQQRKRSARTARSGSGRPPVVLVRGTVAGDDIAEHIAALGCAVRRAGEDYQPPLPAEIGLVVDCADYVLPPRRYTPLMAADVPHLAVIAEDDGATVGPFVLPGRTPCVRCDDLNRLDADRSWAAIATQLAVTSRAPLSRLTKELVRSLVSNSVSSWLTDGTASAYCASDTWTIDALTCEIRRTRRSFHDECGCRALPGSEKRAARRPAARRTARASDAGASVRA